MGDEGVADGGDGSIVVDLVEDVELLVGGELEEEADDGSQEDGGEDAEGFEEDGGVGVVGEELVGGDGDGECECDEEDDDEGVGELIKEGAVPRGFGRRGEGIGAEGEAVLLDLCISQTGKTKLRVHEKAF